MPKLLPVGCKPLKNAVKTCKGKQHLLSDGNTCQGLDFALLQNLLFQATKRGRTTFNLCTTTFPVASWTNLPP